MKCIRDMTDSCQRAKGGARPTKQHDHFSLFQVDIFIYSTPDNRRCLLLDLIQATMHGGSPINIPKFQIWIHYSITVTSDQFLCNLAYISLMDQLKEWMHQVLCQDFFLFLKNITFRIFLSFVNFSQFFLSSCSLEAIYTEMRDDLRLFHSTVPHVSISASGNNHRRFYNSSNSLDISF